MIEQLIPFLIASILLTLSPGPDIIYVLSQSLVGGYKKGMIIALGLVSGIIIHTSLVAFGVSLIIKNSEPLFWSIKIAGALYLLYLAYKVYSSPPQSFHQEKVTETTKNSFFSDFKTGFIMNILNPKVTIFFLAFFPGFLWDTEKDLMMQFYVLGGLFMLQAFVIFSLVAILSDQLSKQLFKTSRSYVFLKWFQIFTFIAIAILILV
ncbi:LysE family translocator [Psychroflexus montanilacus]|uniref:LysE family translocator n=1 Tax=Psychroflexus montanilacus TaxID=2873598 RepID=UPI001CCFB242|nr:LysE family translocator [Psychroflexus montanilacus]MBZ9651937.1 LysE family translocator [Psychroflexus montanilacus]